MKKIHLAALGAALVVGLGSTAAAQSATPGTQGTSPQGQQRQQGHGIGRGMGHGEGRAGGRDAFLLRGITLTDAQRTQVQAINEKYRPQMQAMHDQARAGRGAGDAQPQRADSATRAQMRDLMQRRQTEVRAVLTPEQQQLFDRNLAQARERMKSHGARGGKSGRARSGAAQSGTGR